MLNKLDLMPQDANAQYILKKRAEILAKSQMDSNSSQPIATIPYIRFSLGKEFYGIPFQYAKEVIHNIMYVNVPLIPTYIAGIVNRRGALLTILDLKKFLKTQISEYTKNACIIVISDGNQTIGVLADTIEDSDAYEPHLLDAALTSEDAIKSTYVEGLHNGLTTILNVKTILSDLSIQMEISK